MSLVQFEPIIRWPGPETENRRNAPFRAPHSATEKLLDRELAHIMPAGNKAALQVVTRNGPGDRRNDGQLYARAVATHPGVRLSIQSIHGPLTYATDRFTTWQDNLRAIALGLQALRTVDRYGIGSSGEQYRGWRAIEQTGPGPRDVLKKYAGHHFATTYADELPKLARAARIGAHPDRHNGDHGPHNEVAAAAKQLGVEL